MDNKCPFCENEYSRLGRHAPYCDQKPEETTKDEAKIESIKARSKVDVNKEKLVKWYYEDENSLTDISNKTKLSVGLVSNLFELYGVEKRSLSEGSKKAVDKFEKTCKEKYGVSNPSKLDSVKEKKKETFLENYEVDNIFKADGFRDWVDQLMRDRHGKGSVPNKNGNGGVDFHDEETRQRLSRKMKEWWDSLSNEEWKKRSEKGKQWWKNLSDEEKEKHVEKVFSSQKYESELEDKFEENVLKKLLDDEQYRKQCFISGKAFDFYVPNSNLLVEVNGDYWHANPEIYDESDIISYPGGEVVVGEIRKRDQSKINLAEKTGYNVLEVWESDIENKTSLVVEQVRNGL